MKLRLISTLSIICLFLFTSLTSINRQKSDYNFLKERLKNTKSFTIEVIKAMPESDFLYKPNKDVRSFSALASHTVYSIEWNIELMKGTPIKWEPGNEDRFSKTELIKYANKQFNSLNSFINDAKKSQTLTEKIIDVLNHNAHHRGQMTTYLRLLGIKPPAYI